MGKKKKILFKSFAHYRTGSSCGNILISYIPYKFINGIMKSMKNKMKAISDLSNPYSTGI